MSLLIIICESLCSLCWQNSLSVSVNNLHLVLSTKKQDDCLAHHVQSIHIWFDSIRYYYNVIFDSYSTRQHTLLLQCIFSVNKGVTLITLNSYVETYDGLLMFFWNWVKIKVLYSSYVERASDRVGFLSNEKARWHLSEGRCVSLQKVGDPRAHYQFLSSHSDRMPCLLAP